MRFTLLILILFSGFDLRAQDPSGEMQELYNGSIWIDYLSLVKGDQFLFSPSFLPGSVTLRGKTYNVTLRYDIYEDQVQIPAGSFGILQINKMLIDSFSISNRGRENKFVPLEADTLPRSITFYNVLFEGSVSLYVKFLKKIDKLNPGGENAEFYQVNRILFMRRDDLIPVNRKRDLLAAMKDRDPEVRAFIRKNRIRITRDNPESFVPVVRYYDSLIR